MKGTLTEHPLPELIREICIKELSGTLRLEHDRAKSAVYFEDGQIIFAASNLRTLRLREYVEKRGLIKQQELSRLGPNLPDLKLASLLCGIGKLKQEQVDALFTAMVTDTLRVALLWTDGAWHFDERAHLDEPVRVKVETSNLLREAAKRMPLKLVSSRFRNPKEIISRASQASEANNFLPVESFLLSRLDFPLALEELIALSGLRELDANRIIYGLALSGLVNREHWQYAFRAKAEKVIPEKPIVSEIQPEPSAPATEAKEEQIDLEAFLERLSKATNFYEVLDLPPAAEMGEIKDAYYTLARRYHPDRFHVQSSNELHARISSAFAQVTQAYETLTDQRARGAYDATLKRTQKFSEAASKARMESARAGGTDQQEPAGADAAAEAEEHFEVGLKALQQDQINIAVTHLAIASRFVPNDARFRANYGRALAAREQTRRLAEREILAAVRLEPNSSRYRTMLAELYINLRFYRRAHSELERALSLDPNNAEARSLLRNLEKTGQLR